MACLYVKCKDVEISTHGHRYSLSLVLSMTKDQIIDLLHSLPVHFTGQEWGEIISKIEEENK